MLPIPPGPGCKKIYYMLELTKVAKIGQMTYLIDQIPAKSQILH